MRIFARTIFLAALFTGVLVDSSKADTVYTFVGDKFTFVQGIYLQGDLVTGSFVLSGSFVPCTACGGGIQNVAIGVASYSFTDGHQTLTQSNSTGIFQVAFNLDGTPIVPTDPAEGWYVEIDTPTGEILTEDVSHGDYQTHASTGNSYGEILSLNRNLYPGSAGTWTLQVPEGGKTSLFLFIGLAGLTIITRFNGSKRFTRRL
jgi:hypothetical protein